MTAPGRCYRNQTSVELIPQPRSVSQPLRSIDSGAARIHRQEKWTHLLALLAVENYVGKDKVEKERTCVFEWRCAMSRNSPSTQDAWCIAARKMDISSIICFCCCFSFLCEHPPWQQLFPCLALHHADVTLRLTRSVWTGHKGVWLLWFDKAGWPANVPWSLERVNISILHGVMFSKLWSVVWQGRGDVSPLTHSVSVCTASCFCKQHCRHCPGADLCILPSVLTLKCRFWFPPKKFCDCKLHIYMYIRKRRVDLSRALHYPLYRGVLTTLEQENKSKTRNQIRNHSSFGPFSGKTLPGWWKAWIPLLLYADWE